MYLQNDRTYEVLRFVLLAWKTIGGIADWKPYSGPTPASTTVDYSCIVGLPAAHQYWKLGTH